MANDTKLKANEPKPVTVLKTDRQLSTVRFSPCGKFLAGAGRDAAIRLWDIGEPEAPAADPLDALDEKAKKSSPAAKPKEPVFAELPALKGHDGWVSSIAFHPKEQWLFSADTWGQLICWPYAAKEPKPAWNVKDAHEGWIRQMAVSPDGQILATCGRDQKICLWSTADGKKLKELVGHGEDVFSVAFHPDGKSLVSGDLKGIVKQWELATGKATREFDAKILFVVSEIQDVGGVRALAFDAQGDTMVAAGSQPAGGGFVQGTPVVRFFDWKTGNETKTLNLGDNTEVYVHDILFHPGGYWIGVCSGQPGKGKLFFLRPGEEAPFFSTTKLANCHSVALHPNGVRLTVISNAGEAGQRNKRGRDVPYPGNSSPVNIFDLPQATA